MATMYYGSLIGMSSSTPVNDRVISTYPVFMSEDMSIIAGINTALDPNHLYITYNTGYSWDILFQGSSLAGLCGTSDGKNLYLVKDSYVNSSHDFGKTWTIQSGSGPKVANNITCDSRGQNLAFGAVSSIMLSNDSGVSWRTGLSGSVLGYTPILGLMKSDSTFTNLIALEYYSGVYISNNSGISWTNTLKVNSINQFSDAAISYDGKNIIAANATGIYLSADSGNNWISKRYPSGYISYANDPKYIGFSTDSGFSTLMANFSTGGIYTVSSGIFVSYDTGSSWNLKKYKNTSYNPTNSQTYRYYSNFCGPLGKNLLLTTDQDNDMMALSTNSGNTFTRIKNSTNWNDKSNWFTYVGFSSSSNFIPPVFANRLPIDGIDIVSQYSYQFVIPPTGGWTGIMTLSSFNITSGIWSGIIISPNGPGIYNNVITGALIDGQISIGTQICVDRSTFLSNSKVYISGGATNSTFYGNLFLSGAGLYNNNILNGFTVLPSSNVNNVKISGGSSSGIFLLSGILNVYDSAKFTGMFVSGGGTILLNRVTTQTSYDVYPKSNIYVSPTYISGIPIDPGFQFGGGTFNPNSNIVPFGGFDIIGAGLL